MTVDELAPPPARNRVLKMHSEGPREEYIVLDKWGHYKTTRDLVHRVVDLRTGEDSGCPVDRK